MRCQRLSVAMHSYAISLSCLGPEVTADAVKSLRDSKLRLSEVSFSHALLENEKAVESLRQMREMVHTGAIRVASVHLPFLTKDGWLDPSSPDEDIRRRTCTLFARLIRENTDLLGPNMTMHASMEPIPPGERRVRLDQCRRTIEELLPLAREHHFSLNVEYLPRTCIGNSPDELMYMVEPFDPELVGICLDVNHVMDRWKELPAMVARLNKFIKSFHISDFDGIDELHWFPGQGIIDWPALMDAIRAIDHEVLLIYETVWQLVASNGFHAVSPFWAVRQVENSICFLENCADVVQCQSGFAIPGND